jgi:hypothetical protein
MSKPFKHPPITDTPEWADLLVALSHVRVRVPAWNGGWRETTLADVVAHPNAYCPSEMQIMEAAHV